MPKIVIDITELRSKAGNEAVDDLKTLLKEKLDTEIDVSSGELSLETEKEGSQKISKTYLRVLLRKFLHKTELKEDFRVIAGKENTFIFKERKVSKEEE